MRKAVKLLAMSLILSTVAKVQAQNYKLIGDVECQRFEIDKSLDLHPDKAIAELLAPYKIHVDSLKGKVIGHSSVNMEVRRPESRLSNLISDMLREESAKYGKKADIGLCNMGGLRCELPKGEITTGDIQDMAPFENHFCLLTLKGSDLLTLFEEIARSRGEGISGAHLDITLDGKLLSSSVNGKQVNPKKKYTIATIDYLAEGNDGLTALKKATSIKIRKELVNEVYISYVKKEEQAGRMLNSELEGRITINGQSIAEIEASSGKGKIEHLTVVQTSDTHSCIEPINPNLGDKSKADKGGYLRRAVWLEEKRTVDPDILLVDCGDFSQGSAYYTLYKGEVEVKLMNYMHYDVATIGNHEFDFGLDNMARIFNMADFPIVCCNYDFGDTPLADIVKPYIIIEKKGMKIGVIGVCAQLDGLVAKANCKGVTYKNPVECANPIAAKLKNEEHCDLVIVLSHLGWLENLNEAMGDPAFISGMHNIDAVFGGHTHSYFKEPKYVEDADGNRIPCYHTGKNAQYVGVATFTLMQNE